MEEDGVRVCVCGGGGGCVRKKTAVVVSAVVVVISDDVTVSTLSGGTARTRHVDIARVLIVTARGFDGPVSGDE